MSAGFEKQNNIGIGVQEQVKAHLRQRGHYVIDVSKMPEYQKQDIDFIVRDKANNEITLEIKGDKSLYRTGNILFEKYKEYGDYRSNGWLYRCKAQYLCVVDMRQNKGIILDFSLVSSLLEKHGTERSFTDWQDGSTDTVVLLPISAARRYNAIVYEFNLEG